MSKKKKTTKRRRSSSQEMPEWMKKYYGGSISQSVQDDYESGNYYVIDADNRTCSKASEANKAD